VVEFGQVDPLLQNNSAASGLIVYRGTEIPQLSNLLIFTDMPSGEMFYVSADKLPNGGQDAIRRVVFGTEGDFKTMLQVIQEKNQQQGKKPATRADLRISPGPANQIFLLNKGDGVIRVLLR
jgi:glucose/arabinose dehydrogenase